MATQNLSIAALVTNYANGQRFNSRYCTPLARHLQRSAPADLSVEASRALAAVVAAANEVDAVRKNRNRLSAPSLRTPRAAMIAAWSALLGSLGQLTFVPHSLGNEAVEAQTLSERLFATDASFTRLDAVELWSQSRELLERMTEEGLETRINTLVHPSLVRAVRLAFSELGDALGINGNSPPMLASRALIDASARFSSALGVYVRALSLAFDDRNPSSVDAFALALAPIDQLRSTGRADAAEDGTDEGDALDVSVPGGPGVGPISGTPTNISGPAPLSSGPSDPPSNPFVNA